jgi:uncharacterized protein YecE (DUF72 family)
VTHERRLDLDALEQFLVAIEPIGPKLGPLLVQFHATLKPEDLEAFEPVFAAVADADRRFVIEVRNPAFFYEPELLEPVLER